MRSSYSQKDVVLLLKDITGLVKPQETEERERLIQAGRHYCEMLPVEYVPTEKYMSVYKQALHNYARPVALAVGRLCDKIIKTRGKNVVLVSLARAGTSAGVLLKRYIWQKYQFDVPHYSISIIRGRGIDRNAMGYLLSVYRPQQLLFVDGWIGKGAISRELKKAAAAYPGVSAELAVLADPANITDLCGTHEDILIPSSCLNSTVSGLISRTFLRDDIIGPGDFHGAVYYESLEQSDLTYGFIHAIEQHFFDEDESDDSGDFNEVQQQNVEYQKAAEGVGMEEITELAQKFQISDMNLIKPGIGETTRVLLRRIPWKVLVDKRYKGDKELEPIVRLAEEKKVSVQYYPLRHYKCCGLIQKMADT